MRRSSLSVVAGIALATALASWAGCGDDDGEGNGTGPASTGSIEVSFVVTGASPDADGCVFTVDGAGARRLLAGESATYTGLAEGQHEVAISDVAGNCQVQGDATRSVSVAADHTASVTFALTCASDVGGIRVSATTSGEEIDPDGYDVVVDGGAPAAIDVDGTVTVGGLDPGDHSVALEDVAANCSVAGGNPRTVAVSAGQTADASFAVTCSATSGSLAISASTTGEDLDEDGYEIVIDGGAPSSIAIDGSITAGGLSPGDHTVALQDDAFNCFVAGNNPRTVTVAAGAETEVNFDVACRYHLYNRIAFQSDRSGSPGIYALDPYSPGSERPLGLGGGHPAVSPDGLWIAYASTGDIWLARSDGSGAGQITDTSAQDSYPAWSPDGEWIAFERDDQVWKMRADGSNPTNLGAAGSGPTWSPDGTRIAYESPNNFGDIWVMNASGSGQTYVQDWSGPDYSPAWSPLGNYIAFVSLRDGPAHIFVADPGAGPAVNMTAALIDNAENPAWAPAAEAGVFRSLQNGQYDLYYFVPGSPGVVQLTTDPGWDVHPSWGGGN